MNMNSYVRVNTYRSIKHGVINEGLERVDSRRLEHSYLESVSTSEFGVTTDIRQAPRHAHMIDSVVLGSANYGPLA